VPLGPLGKAFGQQLALDPGSQTCRVFAASTGVVAIPSLVARVEPGSGALRRSEVVGEEAIAVASRAQRDGAGVGLGGVTLSRPIVRGAIADGVAAQRVFTHIFRESPVRKWGARPSVVCGIGPGITGTEQRAFVDALDRSGAKRIKLVPSLAACALTLEEGAAGVGRARLIVEMGYERIGIGVATGAGVIVSAGLWLGGYDLDRVLVGALRRRGLDVTFDQARALREGLGFPDRSAETADEDDELQEIDDVLPRHVGAALRPFVLYVADEIREVLALTPEGAAEDVLGGGVVLCGGAAQTPGLSSLLGEDLGVEVTTASRPTTVRVRGLARYLDYPDLLDEVGREA